MDQKRKILSVAEIEALAFAIMGQMGSGRSLASPSPSAGMTTAENATGSPPQVRPAVHILLMHAVMVVLQASVTVALLVITLFASLAQDHQQADSQDKSCGLWSASLGYPSVHPCNTVFTFSFVTYGAMGALVIPAMCAFATRDTWYGNDADASIGKRWARAAFIAMLVYLCVIYVPVMLVTAASLAIGGVLFIGAYPAVLLLTYVCSWAFNLLKRVCSWAFNLLQRVVPQFAVNAITALALRVARGFEIVAFQVGLFLEWIRFWAAIQWLLDHAIEGNLLANMVLSLMGSVCWGFAVYGCIAFGSGVVQRPELSLVATTLVCWLWFSLVFMLLGCLYLWRVAVRERREALERLRAAKLATLPAP